MSNMNVRASDRVAVLAAINPTSQSAGAVNSAWVSMADYKNLMAIVQAGALGSSATLDAKLQQATDSSGTGAKDIDGLAITQLTQAGSDSNKQAIINCGEHDIDIANGFTHVRLVVTVATAACLTAAMILGLDRRYGVASAGDAASVDEIVS